MPIKRPTYQATWIDQVLNPTLGVIQQPLLRMVRAAQEEDVDVFSSRGLMDPALIPLAGILFNQDNMVGAEEGAERLAEPLGFDADNFGVQFGTMLLTDPLAFATLGISSAGRLAAGAGAVRKMAAKVGSEALPVGGKVSSFIKAADGMGNLGGSLSNRAARRLRKNVDTMKDLVKKDPKLADRSLASLTDEASREVAAIGVPVPFLSNRMQIKLPGMGEGWRNAFLRPTRTMAGVGFTATSAVLDITGKGVAEAAGLIGVGVTGQRNWAAGFKAAADAIMMPVDWGRGLFNTADTPLKVTSAYTNAIADLVQNTDVQVQLGAASTAKEQAAVLSKFFGHKQFARSLVDLGNKSRGEDTLLDFFQKTANGDAVLASTLLDSVPRNPYYVDILGSPEDLRDTKLERGLLSVRQSNYNFFNNIGLGLRKMFQGKTGDVTVDRMMTKLGPLQGDVSRRTTAAAERIGEQYRALVKLTGLPDTEAVDSVFRGVFELMPQEVDEFMVDSALSLHGSLDEIPVFVEHVRNYASRLMAVSANLKGVRETPMSATMKKGWRSLFPELKEGYPVTDAFRFFDATADSLNNLSRSLDELPALAEELKAVDELIDPQAIRAGIDFDMSQLLDNKRVLTEEIDARKLRIEAAVMDLKEQLPTLRHELYQRGRRAFTHQEGKWHLSGETFPSFAQAAARAESKGGTPHPLGEVIFNNVYEQVNTLTRDNMRIAESLGLTSKGSHPMAYVPRVLSARQRNSLDNILSSTEWDSSQFKIYATAGSKKRQMEFVTTDALDQILWALHKQGRRPGTDKIAQKVLDVLNASGDEFAQSPISAVFTRNTEYAHFESTGKMVDSMLDEQIENLGELMAGHAPPGFAGALGGGELVGMEKLARLPVTKYVDGTPQTEFLENWTAVIKGRDGKEYKVTLDALNKVGMGVTLFGDGTSPGHALVAAAAQGKKIEDLADVEVSRLMAMIAEEGVKPQVVFGQGHTVKALKVAAEKEVRASVTMPHWIDAAHRIVKMGVTTGNPSFHALNIASAIPLAQANGMSFGALMRGVGAATSLLWRSPTMDQANVRMSHLFGDYKAGSQGIGTGFGEFIGRSAVYGGVGVGAGYAVDQMRGEEGLGAGATLGGVAAAVGMMSRGSGQSLVRAVESRTLADGGEFVFHSADKSYTMREMLTEGSRHGIFNTFVESGTQALTAESKVLNELIMDEQAPWAKLASALSDAGQQSEIYARLGVFLGFAHMGLTPAQAARKTVATLFDYNDITHFDQHVMKRISSFYTFGKKILSGTAKSYTRDPQKIQRMMHLVWGKGNERYGENNDYYLDTSMGRANAVFGDRTINIGRAMPQLDMVNALGWGFEIFSGFNNSMEAPRGVGEATKLAMQRFGEGGEGVTMKTEVPGIFSGNVVLGSREDKTGNALRDTLDGALRNALLVRSVADLMDWDPKNPEGTLPYDQVVEGSINALGLSKKDAIGRRRRFLNSRADNIDRELKAVLRRPGLTLEGREAIKQLLDRNRRRRLTLSILQ